MPYWYLENTEINIESLEEKIGYRFKDKSLLIMAITHSSYANEKNRVGIESNERLEFLGDAVLNMLISERLYKEYNLPEGEMTRYRSYIVCEASLAACAEKLNLGEHILLGRGERKSGGDKRNSILSDTFEAVVGAVYLDGGIKSVREFIKKSTGFIFLKAINGVIFLDYKTKLQELVQSKGNHNISYEILYEVGPDHNKKYVSGVNIDGKQVGMGSGRTKKEAEQSAAREALEKEGWPI